MLFCLLMKRVAKLTGAAVSMASGNLPILLEGTVQKLLHAYAEAFAARALHRDGFSWIGVSALALFVIFLIGIAWLYRRKLLTKTERNFLFVYVPLTGIVFYGINLVSHLTIFATETQYLEATGMIASIATVHRLQLERCICCSGFFWNAVRGCGEKFRPMQRWLQLYCCVQTGALSMTG